MRILKKLRYPGSDLLTTLIEAIQESPDIKPVALLDRWKNTEFEVPLIQLMKWQPESDDIAILSDEFRDCLTKIYDRADKIKLENLIHKAQVHGMDSLTEMEKQKFRSLYRG